MAFIGAKPTNVPLTSADLEDSIITSAKIVDGTIATADISDGAVTSVKTTGVGGANTPNFSAVNSGSQSLSHDTLTKLSITTETYDSNSAYDSSNSKFTVPSGEGGKYLISVKYEMSNQTSPTYAYIYVNGTGYTATRFKASTWGNETKMIVTLSAGDYVEGYTYQASGGAVDIVGTSGDRGSIFEGYKLIGI